MLQTTNSCDFKSPMSLFNKIVDMISTNKIFRVLFFTYTNSWALCNVHCRGLLLHYWYELVEVCNNKGKYLNRHTSHWNTETSCLVSCH